MIFPYPPPPPLHRAAKYEGWQGYPTLFADISRANLQNNLVTACVACLIGSIETVRIQVLVDAILELCDAMFYSALLCSKAERFHILARTQRQKQSTSTQPLYFLSELNCALCILWPRTSIEKHGLNTWPKLWRTVIGRYRFHTLSEYYSKHIDQENLQKRKSQNMI